jgi:tetratricopeptide (TPR) repeat protein
MKKSLVFLIILILSIPSCKKDDKEIMQEQYEISKNSSFNVQIRDLKGKLKTVKDDYERSVIHTKIANIESEKGDVLSAIKSARDAIKFQPNQYMSHYLLGKSYIESGRFKDAFLELSISIDLNSKFAPAYFELGNVRYKMRKYKSAVKAYKSAVKFDKKHIMALNNLGVLYNIFGKYKKSVKQFNKVIKIDPASATVYKNLGIIYDTRLKNKKKAVANYRKYLNLRPNCPERALVRTWIKVLGG